VNSEIVMTIWSIVNASGMIAGLKPSGDTIATQPVPVHDLILAAIAIAVWVIAIACVAAWLRAREAARAREHIRWIRIDRRRTRSFSTPRPYRPDRPRKPEHSWGKPIGQM
jgi:hypothetical protein